jgi:dUTP pyrophosphatase
MPTRATEYSAGYDLYTPNWVQIRPGEQALVPLWVKWAPEIWSLAYRDSKNPDNPVGVVVGGFFAKIFDKSGLALKSRFNTRAGVIDMDYPDPWNLICVNEGDRNVEFDVGSKIAQFVLLPFLVADDLDTLEKKRDGGFGSTGI